jgi:uncharacterized protein
MEFKSIATEFKTVAPERLLEGYASHFNNSDSYGDVVRPGAFQKTIQERKTRIKILYQHDPWQPIGKPIDMREDSTGLFGVAKIAATPLGDDVLTLAAEGVLNELSIGFDTVKSNQIENGGRELLEVRLWEWSPVTFAANELAAITGVKSGADLEPFIRNVSKIAELGLKSGRVLSATNMNKLKQAATFIQEILLEAEPSDDTPNSSKNNSEPRETHSALTAIHDLKQQFQLEQLAREIRGITAAMRR